MICVAATSAIWWIWTMYVLYQIIDNQKSTIDLIEDLSEDIKSLRIEFREDNLLTKK